MSRRVRGSKSRTRWAPAFVSGGKQGLTINTYGIALFHRVYVQRIGGVLVQVLSQQRVERLLVRHLGDVTEARGSKPVSQRLEVVPTAMLVPLMKDVIDDVHPGWQVVWERVGYSELTEADKIVATVGLQVSPGVWQDNPQNTSRPQCAKALFQESRQFLASFEVFEKLFHPNARGTAVCEGKIPTTVPSHDGGIQRV